MIFFICSQISSMEHYMLDGIRAPHKLLLIPPMTKTWWRRLSHLFWRIGVNIKYNLYGNSFYDSLSEIKIDDIVIFFMVENKEPLLNIVKWIPRRTKKFVWLWNSINSGLNRERKEQSMAKDIESMKQAGCSIATFDPYDAKIFDIHFINQFFNYSGVPQNNMKSEYDFYFIGNPRGKGREEMLSCMKKVFDCHNYTYQFLLRGKALRGYISYKENLINVSKCVCIVEIVRENQTGLSLRPLEALALHKKLITNNANIKYFDFYCPENIFIWNEDDLSRLDIFIRTPYKIIPDTIVNSYDVNLWVCKMLDLE